MKYKNLLPLDPPPTLGKFENLSSKEVGGGGGWYSSCHIYMQQNPLGFTESSYNIKTIKHLNEKSLANITRVLKINAALASNTHKRFARRVFNTILEVPLN